MLWPITTAVNAAGHLAIGGVDLVDLAREYGFSDIDGRQVPLGKGDCPESRAAYHRLLAEWEARGGRPALPATAPAAELVTINVLIDRFWPHAERYYRRPAGTPTPLGAAATAAYALHIARGHGELDSSSIIKLINPDQ